MSSLARPPDAPIARPRDRGLWLAYAGLCTLCWTLYAIAGTEMQRGVWRVSEAVYEATWNLVPPMLLGIAVLPWVRWLQRRGTAMPARLLQHLALHLFAALTFAVLWHAMDYGLARWLFGPEHAGATFEQRVLWRTVWAVFVYTALVLGFGGALYARRAQAAAVAAAQAEAALVRAELAAISGKLNPHFLFNTLNSLIFLTRKDAGAAEQSLLRFARMMRYLLDTQRGAADRVALREELDFVRDYLALESLRLGKRLQVEWHIDDATLDCDIPPLTLQPLVENAIAHGIAPQLEGGTVCIEAERSKSEGTLMLRVSDNGAGCVWPPAVVPRGDELRSGGVGLSALHRRFELDYDGRARLQVASAPGQGFRVEILIPQVSP